MGLDIEGKARSIKEILKDEVKIRPIGPRFIAVRADIEEKTDGGLYLPNRAQEKIKAMQPEAVVIRVSESLQVSENLKPGMRVLLNHTAMQQEFTYNGQDYVMIDWATVKGIYEE